ncbi:AcrR family transcriptional regulator [Paenibacillus sp. PastF-3]|uniref:TetR/AcrR family transcriptional regulator n=1 Tax=Paenibacillus sp. PastF-3 TaxID=2940626 RepID=UPI002475A749|nr:TetR/AcrR family transcriptional regulator [Paenibacillus sp. PastF-3]MDH6368859.1 AcrR family transcriptional regulator [Paenibacillus sp. PastF-3]
MNINNLFNEILISQSTKLTAKQQRIVEAAIRLFAEKGYSNTSTAEIAKLAEVSEASIFKQYGTKDNLLLSLTVPYIKEFFPSLANEAVDQIIGNADSTFEGFLRAFLKNRIEFITENKEIFQVLIKEIIYKEELKNEFLPYFEEIVKPRIANFIEIFIDRGELKDIPIDRLLKLIYSFIGGFIATQFVLLNKDSISDEEIEDAIHFVMDGIRKSSSDH